MPSLIAFSYFSKKIETMAAEMESLIADLLAKCYYQKKRRASIHGRKEDGGAIETPLEDLL